MDFLCLKSPSDPNQTWGHDPCLRHDQPVFIGQKETPGTVMIKTVKFVDTQSHVKNYKGGKVTHLWLGDCSLTTLQLHSADVPLASCDLLVVSIETIASFEGRRKGNWRDSSCTIAAFGQARCLWFWIVPKLVMIAQSVEHHGSLWPPRVLGCFGTVLGADSPSLL